MKHTQQLRRLTKRSDALWEQHKEEHHRPKLIYSAKQKIQAYAAKFGSEQAVTLLCVRPHMTEQWLHWFLDVPLDLEDVRRIVHKN